MVLDTRKVRISTDTTDVPLKNIPQGNGPADYALCVDGIILAILEAKKLTLGPQNVLTQAERYAKGITESLYNFQGLRVPFLYSINGKIIWQHDVSHRANCSYTIAAFHTPETLVERPHNDFSNHCADKYTFVRTVALFTENSIKPQTNPNPNKLHSKITEEIKSCIKEIARNANRFVIFKG